MIHGGMQRHITQVAGQSSLVLRVALVRKNSKMHTRILSTYGPRNGNKEEGRRLQRNDFNEIMTKTCKGHMVIWRTDPNGRLGREEKEAGGSATHSHASARITGPYTRTARTEQGNGKQLQKICQKKQTIPTTTWKKPKIAKKDRWENQKQKEDMSKAKRTQEIQDKYTTIWTCPGGGRSDKSTTSRSVRNIGTKNEKQRETYTGMPIW